VRNKIVIVDDQRQDRDRLLAAMVARGLGGRVVAYSSIKEAKTVIADSGEFPLAIASDLKTGEGDDLENGKEFLVTQYKKAVKRTGGGIWTILISRDRHKLKEMTEDCPEIRRSIPKQSGWAQDCASLLAPLYEESLPKDELLGPLVPFTARDSGVAQNSLAIKDRIFLYSSQHSDLSRLLANCPLLELPEDVQREPTARPIAMYRGNFVAIDKTNTLQAAQLLRRWRLTARECGGPCQRRALSGDDTVPGPKYAHLHNVVGDLRRTAELELLSRHLFAKAEFVPEVKKDDKEVACPPELATTIVSDGFFTRLHFLPDSDDLRHWERWLLWRAEQVSSASRKEVPLQH
jgi:hypothetical protein